MLNLKYSFSTPPLLFRRLPPQENKQLNNFLIEVNFLFSKFKFNLRVVFHFWFLKNLPLKLNKN